MRRDRFADAHGCPNAGVNIGARAYNDAQKSSAQARPGKYAENTCTHDHFDGSNGAAHEVLGDGLKLDLRKRRALAARGCGTLRRCRAAPPEREKGEGKATLHRRLPSGSWATATWLQKTSAGVARASIRFMGVL